MTINASLIEAVAENHLSALVVFRDDKNARPDPLFGLLHIMGLSQAEVAKIVDLDRSRINHYDSGLSPVPSSRDDQFHSVLELYVNEYEGLLDRLQSGKDRYAGHTLVVEAVPVAKAKIAACRKILKAA